MKKPLSEAQLILPALIVLSSHKGYLSTSQLKSELKKRLNLHKKDLSFVSGNTKRFDKTVGNLISHRTLEPYCKYIKNEKGNFLLKIKSSGRKFIFDSVVSYTNIND